MFKNEVLSRAFCSSESIAHSREDQVKTGAFDSDAARRWRPPSLRFRGQRCRKSTFMQIAPGKAVARRHITTLLFTPSQDASPVHDRSELLKASKSPARTRSPSLGRFSRSPLSAHPFILPRKPSMSPNSDIEVSLFRGKLARYLSRANVDVLAKPTLHTPLMARARSPSAVFPARRTSKDTTPPKREKRIETDYSLGPW